MGTVISGRRPPVRPATAVALVCAALVSSACGSSAASSAKASTATTTAALVSPCEAVADALADGPDSDADPVGHAEAQVIPLREIKTSDPALHQAISQLALAFALVVKDGNVPVATAAVATASKRIDVFCPGATS